MGLKNLMGQGPNFVPAYQLSGVPYVTSSVADEVTTTAVRVTFPYVTRWVEVRNTGKGDLRIGFSENGVIGEGASVSGSSESTADHSNYFVLPAVSGSTTRWEARCTELWFASSATTGFSLAAGLTGVLPREYPVLTGSNGFIGIG
tara:strand:+ start:21140 stop:21577 length:438 start_codon:yes stop_codon:yes gene_type:complete